MALTSSHFSCISSFLALLVSLPIAPQAPSDQAVAFASGIKIGEVTNDSAIIWVRATRENQPDFDRIKETPRSGGGKPPIVKSMPTDVVPGLAAELKLRYAPVEGAAVESDWVKVDAKADFTHQFELRNLEPATRYEVTVFGRLAQSSSLTKTSGSFSTAPPESQSKRIKFIVSTCQAVRSLDSGPRGHAAYHHMLQAEPDFFVHTGDILYYDKIPLCKSVAQARAKWGLMFGYEYNRKFHQHVPSYFMKDDHDTLKNDCWPGQKYGELTFDQGLDIFREQVPVGNSTYRTFRWGKDVQIWLTENRDFRSANTSKDGPEKTILGKQQKAWLKKTVVESDATFRFVISPGPIVGPDKKGKNDNHSNLGFAHEGQELRDFLSSQKNTFVICGDRHWQYCSKDPKTALWEFGCGPINDEHNFGGNPGRSNTFHRYFSPKGGFLLVDVSGNRATVQWLNLEPDINVEPKVGHEETLEAK